MIWSNNDGDELESEVLFTVQSVRMGLAQMSQKQMNVTFLIRMHTIALSVRTNMSIALCKILTLFED